MEFKRPRSSRPPFLSLQLFDSPIVAYFWPCDKRCQGNWLKWPGKNRIPRSRSDPKKCAPAAQTYCTTLHVGNCSYSSRRQQRGIVGPHTQNNKHMWTIFGSNTDNTTICLYSKIHLILLKSICLIKTRIFEA